VIEESWIERERRALMPNYRRQPVMFTRGQGASLFDAEGRRYVDCMAGISMINAGHCHPDVVAAIRAQAGQLINTSNLYYTEPMIELAEWIRDHSMGGRVFFCNSGAEATEAAFKLVRKHAGPGRPEIVALVDAFHGRTYGALSLTGQPDKQEAFRPLVPGVRHVARDDLQGLADAVSGRTAAIFLEIIQGEVGVHPVPLEMLRLARELGDRHGALLVIDEIQTGLSRTGPLFAYEDVVPSPRGRASI
jgi:acetylornithine/N-succinyldiaminopimelate aminotransferase